MSTVDERIKSLSAERQELLRRRLDGRESGLAETPPVALSLPPVSSYGAGRSKRKLEFSLSFFSADGTTSETDRYRLLTESARFADKHGFTAVWTPERHFQAFGGLYPNPAVLAAALAMITERVQIRAGSVVLPLHSPVRVAEDWALVDNLSKGRTGVSFATGWHEDDYVIAPGNYASRREVMFRDIQVVRRLWEGEEVTLPGVEGRPTAVKTLPRPIQPHLPFWVTVSSDRTWQRAGEIGANVLTAMGGIPLEKLAQSIAGYRRARQDHGHDPRTGTVSLMLHTYLGTDIEEVRSRAREPLKNYLKSYLNQFASGRGGEVRDPSSPEMQDLLELSFQNYFEHASLLGTPAKCAAMIDRLGAAGVNEAACLIDFGFDFQSVMESLELLADLQKSVQAESGIAGSEQSGVQRS